MPNLPVRRPPHESATPVPAAYILPPVSKPTFTEKLRAVGAVIQNRINDDPLNITLELTRRCNARCDYCNHWQEQKQTEQDLADYVAVVRRFRPFSVTICGGEPFMRKDALDIIRAVRDEPGWRYVSIITNGWFLTEDRAQKLIDTGIDQINVSLNYPDERQDTDRKLPGLFKRISHIVPWMTARGATVQMNSIIMNDNLEDVVPIAQLADSWGASVMYTLYSELPADNHGHLFPLERQAKLFSVLDDLSALKKPPAARRRQRAVVLRHDPDLRLGHGDRRLHRRQEDAAHLAGRHGASVRRARARLPLHRVRPPRDRAGDLHALLPGLPRRSASAAHALARRRSHPRRLRPAAAQHRSQRLAFASTCWSSSTSTGP